MKDLTPSKMILEIKTFQTRPQNSPLICQDRYFNRVLERFWMQNAEVCVTPMKLNLDLQETSYPCDKLYREANGSSLYLLVGTHSDIVFPVARLAKFVEKPTMIHWNCVRRILRFLKNSLGLGLKYC